MSSDDRGAFWRHLNDAHGALRSIDDLDDPFGAEFPRLWAELQELDDAVDAATTVAESERPED